MTATTKRNARRAPGAGVDTERQTSPKPKSGRAEYQGFAGNDRRGQRAPTWTPPKGSAALDRLALLWGPPRTQQRSAANWLMDAACYLRDDDQAQALLATGRALRAMRRR